MDSKTAPLFQEYSMGSGEAAAYLNLSLKTLRNNYRAWGIPAVMYGGKLLFRQADLDTWLEAQFKTGASA